MSGLHEQVDAIITELIQLPRGKTVTPRDYTKRILDAVARDREGQCLSAEMVENPFDMTTWSEEEKESYNNRGQGLK